MPPSLTIRSKLFITLLIASTLSVIGAQTFVYWSFRQGLIELVKSREQSRLEGVRARLVARYRQDGGWERLTADRRLWIATLRGHEDSSRMRPRPRRDRPLETRPRRPDHGPQDDEPSSRAWPPLPALHRAGQPDGPPPRLEMRLMLRDAEGNLLYGRHALLDKTIRTIPLRLDGQHIGTLALLPGPLIHEAADLRFRERQTTALLTIVPVMIILAGALAFPLAKRLTRPVRDFRDTARRLAAGDFSARLPTQANDELGRLGRDLNGLAETLERNEQARRRWVADISHELRTPVALLRAEIEALQDGIRRLDRDAIDALHADILRLGRLVDDLYELSMAG